MSKTVLIRVLLIGAMMNASLFAQNATQDEPVEDNVKYAWADVLRVDPIYDYARTGTREQCYDTSVEHRGIRGNNAGGAVLGAIVGGALGNTVGKGDGRTAATVAGALIGGTIGHDIASKDDRYVRGTETRCRIINGVTEERRIVGYDIEYRYRGDVYASRMDYDPGERMRIRVSVTPAE